MQSEAGHRERAVIVHSIESGRYVVDVPGVQYVDRPSCRGLAEVYDYLRSLSVNEAMMAQQLAYDEMIGSPGAGGTSYLPLHVPPE